MCGVIAITLHKVVNFSQKAKKLIINPEGEVRRCLFFLSIIIFLISSKALHAQVENPIRVPDRPLPAKADTLPQPIRNPADTLTYKNDTLKSQPDSLQAPTESDIETTIQYSARDSINSNLETRIIRLYGDAHIKYGDIELDADEIIIDYEQSTISANGKIDSTGRRVGFPIFKNGSEVYETKSMVYNFKTKKAKISEVVTQQGDGFMHGGVVYKNEKNELFTINNAYTTCNLTHPHFQIISRRAKAIPGDKIVSGPFYMEFNDVPTPLGFAFGIFPSPKKSASGILVPSYGEERLRGFFLKNGGYYFDINEYIKLGVTGDLYSSGSSALYVNSNYSKRYHYGGAFNFTYTNNRFSDRIEDNQRIKDFRLGWSHTPQTKGTSRFSASVNAATSSFSNNNFLGINANPNSTRLDNTTRKLSSNVSYSKTFSGTPFALGVNLRHNQDLVTKQVDLPLPDLSFNVNNIYPFKQVSTNEFLENMNVRYTMNGTNKITNNLGRIGSDPSMDSIAPFTFESLGQFLKNSKKGMRHSIPLSTSVKLLRFFTVSPGISYDELWYFEKLDYELDSTGTRAILKDTIRGFNRISNYSFSVGLNTRLYGMFLFKNPKSKIKAIRHVINPTVSYSYTPDFADPRFGYYQQFTDTTNNRVISVARHQGFVYGSSRSGKSNSISFGIGNSIDMKVRTDKDSVDKKISILNNLSLSSSYNFAADSFKLSPIGLSTNTNVLNDKLNINLSGVIDPYQYRVDSIVSNEAGSTIYQRRIDRFAWRDGFRLGQLSNLNLALSTNLSPAGRNKDKDTRDRVANANIDEADKQQILNNPEAYVDFTIPWNLRVNYNLGYSRTGRKKATITQALRLNGDISLTEKWKVTFNTGYDFESREFTQTFLSIHRELHCWQVSLGWTPFGRFQSYNFSIGVKSSLLQDLKLDRTRSFFDNF